MSKVYLDEINAALSSSTFSTLSQDNKDSGTVNTSINSFINDSGTKLKGDQWDKVRTKLGVYQTALEERMKVAETLSAAISKALNLIKDYMSPYQMLDSSKIGEYRQQRQVCVDSIASLKSMLTETVTVSYKKDDGTTGYTTKPAYDNTYIQSQIYLAEATLKELDKLIEKVEGLDAVYQEAEGILKTAYEDVLKFQSTVSAITPSGKYSYQK